MISSSLNVESSGCRVRVSLNTEMPPHGQADEGAGGIESDSTSAMPANGHGKPLSLSVDAGEGATEIRDEKVIWLKETSCTMLELSANHFDEMLANDSNVSTINNWLLGGTLILLTE